MTDSATAKKERLVQGARMVLYAQGVEKTTIADVATAADVPLGNVYYYFKTKDDLVKAAIDAHAQEIQAKLAGFEESNRTPKTRLKAFVREWIEQADMAAQYGCPHGSLCAELDKGDGALGEEAAKLIELIVDWNERQFKEMGFNKREAHENAMELVASFQGAALLANTYGDPGIVVRQSKRSERWIDSLS